MGPDALAWFQAASPIIGGALKGTTPNHSESSANTYAAFDNSGWTVATGGAKASALPALDWTTMAILAVAAVVVLKALRK